MEEGRGEERTRNRREEIKVQEAVRSGRDRANIKQEKKKTVNQTKYAGSGVFCSQKFDFLVIVHELLGAENMPGVSSGQKLYELQMNSRVAL